MDMKKEELPMIIQMFIDSFTKDMGQPPTVAQINDFLSHHARSVNSIEMNSMGIHQIRCISWYMVYGIVIL